MAEIETSASETKITIRKAQHTWTLRGLNEELWREQKSDIFRMLDREWQLIFSPQPPNSSQLCNLIVTNLSARWGEANKDCFQLAVEFVDEKGDVTHRIQSLSEEQIGRCGFVVLLCVFICAPHWHNT